MNELAKRTVFGLLFVVVVIGSILLHNLAFSVVMLATIIIGSMEVGKLMVKENHRGIKVIVVSVMILTIVLLALTKISEALWLFLPFIPMIIAVFSKKYSFTEIVMSCWVSLFFVFIPCCVMIVLADKWKEMLIALFCMIWINDIFAYLIGRAIGKHKLCERISPNKTIEGSIGGLVMTIAVTLLGNYFCYFMPWPYMLELAFVVVVFGTLGDLCESMMKRQAGVKDSGNVIPGHGGILDRFDAAFLAMPFAYIYLSVLSVI